MNVDDYGIVLEWDRAGQAWNARVPDLPGCLSHGSVGGDQAEAVARAREAITCHLRGLAADGEAAPPADRQRPPVLVKADVFPTGVPGTAPAEMVAALVAAGFTGVACWGVHQHLRHGGTGARITIPSVGEQPVPEGTLQEALRVAGLPAEATGT